MAQGPIPSPLMIYSKIILSHDVVVFTETKTSFDWITKVEYKQNLEPL